MASTLKVNTIAHSGGTTAMSIDSTGRITKPSTALPAWRVGLSATISGVASTTTVVNWDDTNDTNRKFFIQGGCTISSGIVTVPVTGIYQLSTSIRFDNVDQSYLVVRMVKNNEEVDSSYGTYVITNGQGTSYQSLTDSTIFPLTAGDTVKVDYFSGDSSYSLNLRSYFSGVLIG